MKYILFPTRDYDLEGIHSLFGDTLMAAYTCYELDTFLDKNSNKSWYASDGYVLELSNGNLVHITDIKGTDDVLFEGFMNSRGPLKW